MGRGGSKALPTVTPGGGGGGGKFGSSPDITEAKTLKDAIGKKGRPMSMTVAAAGANPYYNPAYGEFSENCQRAVIAYEMRRRGYDVTARPTFAGDKLPVAAYETANRRFMRLTGAFKGAKSYKVGASTPNATLNNIKKKMAGYGDGSRAIMTFGWKRGRSGHAINVEFKNGKLNFNDAQIGGKYDPSALMKAIRTGTVTITRTDNLRISDRMRKSVEQGQRRRGKKR